jgi:glutamate synthase domain-containing protein 2
VRCLSTRLQPKKDSLDNLTKEEKARKTAGVSFPDLIEHWSRDSFYKCGYIMTAGGAALTAVLGICQEALIFDTLVAAYWYKGYQDMNQNSHTILKNFPVLGNARYLFEVIRPEIRQYFVESDQDGRPYDREHRSIVYQRAKDVQDTLPFGTRRNVYESGYEWANHSMYPTTIKFEDGARVIIGGPDCTRPYDASILNISAMSYGALSDNAILALSTAGKSGNFFHNTGEGGVSRFHKDGGAALVWNVGTGYFGCRDASGNFSADEFQRTVEENDDQIKMIEIKLSQGAKPGHGGLLPGAKVTPFIAEARGVEVGVDCHSPPTHSAFSTPEEFCGFIKELRTLSGGKPVGFKLCLGRPEEFCSIVQGMLKTGIYPDFITIDGGEGGTGAAPPEFSNSIGTPLVEGLTFIHRILIGAGIRDRIKIISSGKVSSGFAIVRNLAIGADVCNAARAMLFALGCVQALKCNTNRCPTGITTQDKELQKGLDVDSKSVRVHQFHTDTVHAAVELMQAIGVNKNSELEPYHINRRVSMEKTVTFDDLFIKPEARSLLQGTAPIDLQSAWDRATRDTKKRLAMSP